MEFHWDKFQLLQVECQSIRTPSGDRIELKQNIDYLGSIVSCDGLPGHELGRRIWMAKADFLQLQKVWKHSSLPIECRRLDGFQNRCPRCILGICPAFISRISNACVLRRAGCQAATNELNFFFLVRS